MVRMDRCCMNRYKDPSKANSRYQSKFTRERRRGYTQVLTYWSVKSMIRISSSLLASVRISDKNWVIHKSSRCLQYVCMMVTAFEGVYELVMCLTIRGQRLTKTSPTKTPLLALQPIFVMISKLEMAPILEFWSRLIISAEKCSKHASVVMDWIKGS